ncbi:Cell cycle control protein isoform 1 [Schistosoma japonicum]|uniref:Cell cycle control protein isoform 1 n=2 Tax=Schistosoma japonicum TaxID=6182 RepID=A0A4Z2D2J0_SCHJA|nr:Cell cycle control protein 50A [Schistosoma japonicum]KAH8861552.1 Cell cycle control protein 50A [Schistosoma japonicum]KAH8861554.1 Cell cycle control protein 50A [Schistosoma japonicum]TNN10723.1 Cell cycle control protein isoform 1 [Schistosoma japonicum]TNN10728.1 Cell cycle control protein isoform 1 [Schistosoma japonicum]
MSLQLFDTPLKSRRPKDSAFFQQKLPAWQPLFTAKKSGIAFTILGVLLIPIGIILLVTSNNVVEYHVDYTDCIQNGTQELCSKVISSGKPCVCVKQITVETSIPRPVYLYYGLKNFYQNHRRYVRSKSDEQLLGIYQDPSSLTSCGPYASIDGRPIVPCGAIANSIFNDTFSVSYTRSDNTKVDVTTTTKGIAWPSDIDRRFGTLDANALNNTVKPPNWPQSIQARSSNPFKTDEALIVWMRIAALPSFRKLNAYVVHKDDFANGLPSGTYDIVINYFYPVTSFGGRKTFILANASWLGGKNPTLGISCLVTGSIHICLGIAFLVVHFIYGKRPAFPPSACLIRCAN